MFSSSQLKTAGTLLALWALALFLRLHHQSPDNLYFADEGNYIGEARFLISHKGGIPLAMAKPFYSFFLALGLLTLGNQIINLLRLQAIISSLWILAVYFLSLKIFQSRFMAITASILTIFDPWIFIYSRHLFPDPLAGLLWMTSLFCLFNPSLLTFSALFAGLSAVTNYRMILLNVGLFFFLVCHSNDPFLGRLKKGSFWIGFSLLPVIACQIAYKIFLSLKQPDNHYNYFHQLVFLMKTHAGYGFRLDSLGTFPALVFHYEGIFAAFVGLVGLATLLIGKKYGPTLSKCVFFTYLFPVLLFSFSHFPFARVWAPLLFWHTLLMAVGVREISQKLSHRFQKTPKHLWEIALIGLLVVGFFPRLLALQNVRVPYQQAIQYIKEKQNHPVLFYSTLTAVLPQLMVHPKQEDWWVESLDQLNDELTRKKLGQLGFHLALVDPYQYVETTFSVKKERSPLVQRLRTTCRPALEMPCQNPEEFWNHFAWEHNVSFQETKSFLEKMNIASLSCLEIYDLDSCRL